MTDPEILFRRIKDVALKSPHRSEQFKTFCRSRNGVSGDFHHVCGSTFKLKSTDLLGVIVDHQTHINQGDDRDWIIAQLPKAIDNALAYIVHLETELEIIRLKHRGHG